MVRTLDSQSKKTGWDIFFSPRCLSSLNCINEYPVIDSGRYVNEQSLQSNCREVECFVVKLTLN